MSTGGMVAGGGIGAVIIAVIVALLGGDPSEILQGGGAGPNMGVQAPANQEADDQAAKFTRVVLADTEDVWAKLFADHNARYRPPTLVMFRGVTESGCGTASRASGPFYCPLDQKVYIDLSFYDELARRFQAPGEFAMAYVIAHEIGHHIQNLEGTLDKVNAARERLSKRENNQLSVRVELQADFYAGVWAHHAQQMKNILEDGDIEAALRAANAIGDDHIQQQTQGTVVPDAFTHGTSAQRMYWFKKGLQTGDLSQGDTFNSREDANLQ
jgi:hypothetical protein